MAGIVLGKSTNAGQTLFYVTDKTVWDGDENPLRESVALLALAIYKPTTGDVNVAVADYAAEDVVTFEIDVTGHDGRYTVYVFALDRYTSGALDVGAVVFDMNDRNIKKQTVSGLEIVTIDSLIDEDVVVKQIADAFFTTEASKRLNSLERIALETLEASITSKCEINEYEQALTNHNYVRFLRAVAKLDYCKGLYSNAQIKIEKAISFADAILDGGE